MTDDSLFLIDVDKILRTKAPKQYKYIPKFVVSYLKKIVHQDEINVFLNESKDKLGVDFLEACMEFLDAKVEVKGIENLPKEGLGHRAGGHEHPVSRRQPEDAGLFVPFRRFDDCICKGNFERHWCSLTERGRPWSLPLLLLWRNGVKLFE